MVESAPLLDPDPKCKVFVCAALTGNAELAILRSYDTAEVKYVKDCAIWEACRATSAAKTFFDPIKIGNHGQEFADGGIIYNNPIQRVEVEASIEWPGRFDNAILLSIGTGSAPGVAFKGRLTKIITAMKEIVTQTQKTADDFHWAHENMYREDRLFRFNVYHGLSDVGLEEWKEKDKITSSTQAYLVSPEVRLRTNKCIDVLSRHEYSAENIESQCSPPSRILLKDMEISTETPSTAPTGPHIAHLSRRKSYSQGETEKKACIKALSFRSMGNREANIELAHRNTCDWLFSTPEFHAWINRKDIQGNNGVLWIKGHPGVGKSTLVKHTLLHCLENFKTHIIAFYGFNARGKDVLERSPLGMLRSLMTQLLEQSSSLQEPVIRMFTRKNTRHGECLWGLEELKDLFLQEYQSHHHERCIILIDALDECNAAEIEDVVAFLATLSENATESASGLLICLSSRHYPTIDMNKKLEVIVEEHKEHDRDIAKYVAKKLKTEDQDIQDEINRKAQHIFIWVVLVVDILNREHLKGKGTVKAMRERLKELPSDLDQLFFKILNIGQSRSDKEATLLLFLWALFSKRTLNAEELYWAAGKDDIGEPSNDSNVDYDTTKLFINHTSLGLMETVIYPLITNLTTRKANHYYVQFIHKCVVDFLTRNRRLLLLDPNLVPSIVGASHDRLAIRCLAYIKTFVNSSVTLGPAPVCHEYFVPDLEWGYDAYPFLEYACRNMLEHAEAAQVEGTPQPNLLHDLENQSTSLRCINACLGRQWGQSDVFKQFRLIQVLCWGGYTHLVQLHLEEFTPNPNLVADIQQYGTALEIAAGEGKIDILGLLLDININPNSWGEPKCGNPLKTAVINKRKDIVTLLLEYSSGDFQIKAETYYSALEIAVAEGYTDIASLFLPFSKS